MIFVKRSDENISWRLIANVEDLEKSRADDHKKEDSKHDGTDLDLVLFFLT